MYPLQEANSELQGLFGACEQTIEDLRGELQKAMEATQSKSKSVANAKRQRDKYKSELSVYRTTADEYSVRVSQLQAELQQVRLLESFHMCRRYPNSVLAPALSAQQKMHTGA